MAVRIAIAGDFQASNPTHAATNEGLRHAGEALNVDLDILWVPTESPELQDDRFLSRFDGIVAAPGSPYRDMNGALAAIHYARRWMVPFTGT